MRRSPKLGGSSLHCLPTFFVFSFNRHEQKDWVGSFGLHSPSAHVEYQKPLVLACEGRSFGCRRGHATAYQRLWHAGWLHGRTTAAHCQPPYHVNVGLDL